MRTRKLDIDSPPTVMARARAFADAVSDAADRARSAANGIGIPAGSGGSSTLDQACAGLAGWATHSLTSATVAGKQRAHTTCATAIHTARDLGEADESGAAAIGQPGFDRG